MKKKGRRKEKSFAEYEVESVEPVRRTRITMPHLASEETSAGMRRELTHHLTPSARRSVLGQERPRRVHPHQS